MNKEILLIHPSNRILNKQDNLFTNESLTPSLGLAMLAGHCRQNNIAVRIMDLRLSSSSISRLKEEVERSDFLFAGITAFTTEINQAHEAARIIKESRPGLPVVIGGVHASLVPEGTLEEFKDFDLAVIGEGEGVVVDLARIFAKEEKRALNDIPGVALRVNGKIRVNPSRRGLEDIDKLSFPAWDLFDIGAYSDLFMVSASRGCPYKCYFCTPDYLGYKLRVRDPLKVVDEMEYLLRRFNVRKIQFSDAALSLMGQKTSVMCDEIIRRGLSDEIEWECETRADALDQALLAKMKQAGCRWIALGIETGNSRILEEVIGKSQTKKQIKDAVRAAKQAGVKVRCFFTLGHYTESSNTIKETVKFALELNPDALSFGLLVPNPGSGVRKLAEDKENGLRILHNHWERYNQFDYDCFESKNLSLSELKKWRLKAYLIFYFHHPLKALNLFLDKSGYNYNFKSIVRILKVLFGGILNRNGQR